MRGWVANRCACVWSYMADRKLLVCVCCVAHCLLLGWYCSPDVHSNSITVAAPNQGGAQQQQTTLNAQPTSLPSAEVGEGVNCRLLRSHTVGILVVALGRPCIRENTIQGLSTALHVRCEPGMEGEFNANEFLGSRLESPGSPDRQRAFLPLVDGLKSGWQAMLHFGRSKLGGSSRRLVQQRSLAKSKWQDARNDAAAQVDMQANLESALDAALKFASGLQEAAATSLAPRPDRPPALLKSMIVGPDNVLTNCSATAVLVDSGHKSEPPSEQALPSPESSGEDSSVSVAASEAANDDLAYFIFFKNTIASTSIEAQASLHLDCLLMSKACPANKAIVHGNDFLENPNGVIFEKAKHVLFSKNMLLTVCFLECVCAATASMDAVHTRTMTRRQTAPMSDACTFLFTGVCVCVNCCCLREPCELVNFRRQPLLDGGSLRQN